MFIAMECKKQKKHIFRSISKLGKETFAECPRLGTWQSWEKNQHMVYLPSAWALTLMKEFLKKSIISLLSALWKGTWKIIFRKIVSLPSALREGTRQRIFKKKFISLPSALREGTRQRIFNKDFFLC